ncbi:MAG: Ig-like domain-containing protein, partial [Actinomycetota bacterium]|nr:Ig-like domain-containing protein [Actinomycetota bacterium]
TYSHTGAPTDPAEPNNVTATNNASNTSNPVSFTVTPDPNPPANMSASITGGYYTTAAINVTLANGNDGAGESGLDTTSGVIERDEANLAGDTCAGFPGTWSTVTLDGSGNDTTVQSGKCYRYRYKISDRVGNQGTQAGVSSTAKVDTSGPGAPTLAFSGLTNAWENGSGTVYFKGNAAGGFTVTPSATDAESGVASYAYPALGGSWSNTAGAYTFDSSSPDPTEPNNLHGINGAGTNGADVSITVTEDSNAPSGMSASVTAGYVTSTSVAVTLASGSDGAGESGLDPVSELLERDETPLAGGACDPFPGSWSTVTLSGGNDTTVQSGKCYRYRYSISDRVGNQGVSGASATVKIDTTPPAAPSLAYSGFTRAWENGSGTVYFKGGAAGGFTITGTASDPESGVASYSFPALGAGWSAVGSGATRTYSFAAAAIDPAEPNDVTATNNAGRTSTPAPLTVTADSTPPDDGGISYVDGFSSSSSLAVALDDGSDAGAGIDTTTEVLERSVGTLANGSCTDFGGFTALAANPALSYDDLTVLAGKCYAYRYVVQDRLGNATTYTTSAVAKVDLDAPAATQGDPGPYLRGSVTLTGTATDAGGSDVSALAFQYSDDSGATWQPIGTDASSPYSVSFDTTTAATPDGVYDLRTVATDGAGSSSPSPVVAARRIDNTAPSASITSPAANVRAVVNLSATVSDGSGSGISTTTYQFSSDDGATWTTTPASWNTALSSDGMYRVRVVATDNAGNQATDTSGSFRVDNTPPTASMDDPGPYLSGTVNLTSSSGDSGSGVDTVTYERSPAGGGSWTSVPAAWDTSSAADGLYDLRVAVVDLAGNRTDSTPKTGIRVDNTKPNVSLDSPTSNDDVAGTVTLTSTADDTGSGLAGPLTYEYRTHPAPAGPWIATPATWDTTLLADGGYDLRATAVDRAGNSKESNVAADVRVDNTPPTIALTAPADGSYVNAGSADPYALAATATDAGSGIKQVEFFECSDASVACATGTWSSVAVHAAPGPYGADWTITTDGHRALRAVATDNADRTASSIVEVTIDRTLPDTAIVTKPGDPSNEAAPTFTFSSTEDSTFECSLDGGAFSTCTSPHVLPSLADGTHDFSVRAIDLAGNTDLSAATWTWLTDLTPPTATIDNPGENVRAVVTITSTQDDPGGANASGIASVAFEYSADGGTSWAPTPASWDTGPITDGLYKLRVLVRDNAGNETIDTLASEVRVDNTAPASSQDDPGQYLRQTVALTGSAADPDDPMGRPGSGVTQVRFEVSPAGAETWTAIGAAAAAPYGISLDTSTLADGRYDFRTVATDAAGNEAPGGTVTNRLIDNTVPTA